MSLNILQCTGQLPWTKDFPSCVWETFPYNMLSPGNDKMNKPLPSKGSPPRCNLEITYPIKLTWNQTGYFYQFQIQDVWRTSPLPSCSSFSPVAFGDATVGNMQIKREKRRSFYLFIFFGSTMTRCWWWFYPNIYNVLDMVQTVRRFVNALMSGASRVWKVEV